jgi:adenosylcobyric acid synthase
VTLDVHALREASIERLADAVERHLDTRTLEQLLGMNACVP